MFNTIVGMIITMPAYVMVKGFGMDNPLLLALRAVLYWLGISIMMHAFPSTGDAKSMAASILKNKEVNIFAKIVAAPFIGLIYIGAFGSMFWLDLIYAVAMSMVLPNMLGLFIR